jgi:hypothetical protein
MKRVHVDSHSFGTGDGLSKENRCNPGHAERITNTGDILVWYDIDGNVLFEQKV